ncbi:HIRAN domain-containing protein [Sphingomonas sanxanigenens]|uniref:HIRAN domain-containing protein n=1 Tax=Sphingomonas sanxanigenens DSM 19645 = NX02 TaxID=1123269 RepID=W0AHN9_9SPHN|nr:HIRAN domain-containing protein [Sphingomonas sanxanigenens]AHE56037.1 hypothetical protein NX02_22055 [Sphingomonas sanxanigenens DSM 19645 = NX02]
MPRELSLAVVGAQYPNKRGPTRAFGIAMCRPGDPIELRPEPKNPADERAVAVFTADNIQIGYITAERAPYIGGIIKAGREVRTIFQAPTQWGAIVRCAFDGASPSLPARRPAAAPADFDDIDQTPPAGWDI